MTLLPPLRSLARYLLALTFAGALFAGCGGDASSGDEHTLVLKDGRLLRGALHGRSADGFQFAVDGEVREFPESDVHSITLVEGSPPLFLASATPAAAPEPEPAPDPAPPAAAPPPPAPAPPRPAAPAPRAAARAKAPPPTPVAAAPAPRVLIIPHGTTLMLKLDEDVGTATHPRGAPVSASLDRPVTVDGVIAIPRGAKVYGRVMESTGGRQVRSQKLVLEFDEVTVGNELVPIATDRVGAEGGGGSGVRKVGAGALIGGAFGGKSGAGKGALVGAGLSALTGGGQIRVPGGSLMELHLRAPVTIEQ